mmetsp:Transcript_19393/g.50978  ORF Transcript_19393/g.50978 Transcript_19393/m.50978 type:complete len:378 (+) Transcript_19393:489-1622(+)
MRAALPPRHSQEARRGACGGQRERRALQGEHSARWRARRRAALWEFLLHERGPADLVGSRLAVAARGAVRDAAVVPRGQGAPALLLPLAAGVGAPRVLLALVHELAGALPGGPPAFEATAVAGLGRRRAALGRPRVAGLPPEAPAAETARLVCRDTVGGPVGETAPALVPRGAGLAVGRAPVRIEVLCAGPPGRARPPAVADSVQAGLGLQPLAHVGVSVARPAVLPAGPVLLVQGAPRPVLHVERGAGWEQAIDALVPEGADAVRVGRPPADALAAKLGRVLLLRLGDAVDELAGGRADVLDGEARDRHLVGAGALAPQDVLRARPPAVRARPVQPQSVAGGPVADHGRQPSPQGLRDVGLPRVVREAQRQVARLL